MIQIKEEKTKENKLEKTKLEMLEIKIVYPWKVPSVEGKVYYMYLPSALSMYCNSISYSTTVL